MAQGGGSPRFVTGSILRHVVVMATTGALGLVAVFAVDLLNLFYLARLGEPALLAAIGFTGVIGFLQISAGIGLAIGVGAVVSTTIGAGRMAEARRIATTSVVAVILVAALLGLATVVARGPLLDAVGATGAARPLASRFITIVAPSMPLLVGGMCGSALLRALGDARRSMNVTLLAAVAAAVFDPILIFGFHLGLTGAAISTVLSRSLLGGLALFYLRHHHTLLVRPRWGGCGADLRRVGRIAAPAILTNLATPIGNGFVVHAIARFGPEAVAGQAVIDRITPMAFGIVYALTGAVGPIMAQNLGAGRADRVRETLRSSLLVVLAAVLFAWALLASLQTPLMAAFSARGEAVVLIRLFCDVLAAGFLFNGALFVANAAFNNLGRPFLSTTFNWGRATVGTVPLVMLAARHGPGWVLGAQAMGGVVFGTLAVLTAFRVTARLGPPAVATPLMAATAAGASALAEEDAAI